MLVLTRKLNQSVLIGSSIEIRVLETYKGGVKLGFSALLEVRIRRGELQRLPLDAEGKEPSHAPTV